MSKGKPTKAAKAHTSLDESIFVAQVRLLYTQVHTELIANSVIAILLGVIFLTARPHWLIGVWIAYMAVVFAGRYFLIKRFKALDPPDDSMRQWKNRFVLGTLLTGIGWGSFSLGFYPFDDPSLQFLLLSILVVLTATSVTVLTSVMSAFWSFLIPVIVPLSIIFFVHGDADHIKLGLFALLYLLFISIKAQQYHKGLEKPLHQNIVLQKEIQSRKLTELELIEEKINAQEASRTKSEFVANMSHELRTPLNAIIGFSGVLMKNRTGNLRESDLDRLEKVNRNGRRLLSIINNILDLSKIEATKLELEQLELDIYRVVEEVIGLLKDSAMEKNLQLRLTIERDVPQLIIGDPTRIWQILNNLVGNAIKFTDDGEITVNVSVKERVVSKTCLTINVKDTGVGIEEEAKSKLFQPFIQEDTTTSRKFGGTGLGLVISKKLADLMGGDITMDSKAGGGSTFTCTIWCYEAESAPFKSSAGKKTKRVGF